MDECGIGTDCSSVGHEKISWKLLCYSVLSGAAKRERQKSYFDILKYAQTTKVALSRNMMRYEHMDKRGIGTDCLRSRLSPSCREVIGIQQLHIKD